MKFSVSAVSLLAAMGSVAHALKFETSAFSPIEMVASAHYLATDAGERILAMGGTVVDAMVAVQTVLSLVEPQASGIGGGAFVVLYMDGELTTFDAREKAPALATETRFVDENGTTLVWEDAWQSGLGVGVPGIPRLMEDLHKMHGKLAWEDLFSDAKELALNGYPQSNRTEKQAADTFAELNEDCENRIFMRDDEAFEYFFDTETCTPKPAGTIMTNPAYAATLDLLIAGGANAFYTGPLAEAIVAKVAADRNPTGDATISMEDMANYDVVKREPVCKTYREKWDVCGMPPPGSGGLAIGQVLGILNNYNITESGLLDVDTVHLFTQAMRLAFADRNKYVGDTDFVTVPIEGMLDDDYLAERAGLINMTMDMGEALPGAPPGVFDPSSPQTEDNEQGTSHISIADQYGNSLSMTTTIEWYFGSSLMVNGFLLNNQITDFSFSPVGEDGVPIANRVQPSKRPRSSMSPTIVMDKETGEPSYVVGSPGGSRIIGFTARALLAMLDFGVDPQEAANTAIVNNRNGDTEVEPPTEGITYDYDYEVLVSGLESRGHTVSPTSFPSGLSLVKMADDGFLGGADPRRDGTAGGRETVPDEEEGEEGGPIEESDDPAVNVTKTVEEGEDEKGEASGAMTISLLFGGMMLGWTSMLFAPVLSSYF